MTDDEYLESKGYLAMVAKTKQRTDGEGILLSRNNKTIFVTVLESTDVIGFTSDQAKNIVQGFEFFIEEIEKEGMH